MKQLKYFLTFIIAMMMAVSSNAWAADILAAPATLPLEENGQAWNHPSATVTGTGELKIEDEGANIPVDVTYEGTISCTVSASSVAAIGNEVEIKPQDIGRESEAKSDAASLTISGCTVNGVAIADPGTVTGEVEVEIEGLYEVASGSSAFGEYEAEGKTINGAEVELELNNGTVTTTPTGPPTVPPSGF